MEKELYIINKEAKELRNQNLLLYENSKPQIYYKPTFELLNEYAVEYNEQLVDLGIYVEIDHEYYPYYAVSDVCDALIEHHENESKSLYGWDDDDIEHYVKELESIEYDNRSTDPHEIIKDNKQKIKDIYRIKTMALKKLLKQNQAQVINTHEFQFGNGENSYGQYINLISYNGFTFHIETENEIKAQKCDQISAENKLNKSDNEKINFKTAYAKIREFVFGKEN